MIRPEVVERLKEIDFNALRRGLEELGQKLYDLGLVDWVDQAWEHPEPDRVDAVYGDLYVAKLELHGHGAPYLDSCAMCTKKCERGLLGDAGWTCNEFARRGHP